MSDREHNHSQADHYHTDSASRLIEQAHNTVVSIQMEYTSLYKVIADLCDMVHPDMIIAVATEQRRRRQGPSLYLGWCDKVGE